MSIYVYTGKLGSGKSLCAVGRIREFLNKNLKVATNLDLTLYKLVRPQAKKCVVFRLPDRPSIEDLDSMGFGGDIKESKNEELHGLIVLDECAHFLNTRNFQSKDRQFLIDWFVSARKRGWHVIFIIQHLNALDKQFRDMFAEHIVYCNRMDRLRLPFYFRWPVMMLGFSGKLPKIHRALVMYGSGQNAMKVDSYVYQGKDLYETYDTQQIFNGEYTAGIYQYLPPYYTHGRFHNDWYFTKQKINEFINNSALKVRHFFLIGLTLGMAGMSIAHNETFVNPSETELLGDKIIDVAEPEEAEEDYIYIVGSILGNYQQLFFERNGVSFDPRNEGYQYHISDKCHAKLFKDDLKIDVYCGAVRARERAPVAQYESKALKPQPVKAANSSQLSDTKT